jgi:hypothetical protein
VRIGDNCGNYFQYNNEWFQDINPHILNEAWGQWKFFEIPLSGSDTWIRTEQGEMTFDGVGYIEFNVDVWGYGYELWLDGVTLPVAVPSAVGEAVSKQLEMAASPNPFSEETKLTFEMEKTESVSIEVLDLTRRQVWLLPKEEKDAGLQEIVIHTEEWGKGIYFVKVVAGEKTGRLKILKL